MFRLTMIITLLALAGCAGMDAHPQPDINPEEVIIRHQGLCKFAPYDDSAWHVDCLFKEAEY